MTYANTAERRALISGLRALADFLESNSNIPAPTYIDVMVFPSSITDASNRREIDVIAERIGSETRTVSSHRHYTTSRRFGPVEYRAVAIPSDDSKEH
jgi:hypothetical protein